MVHITGTRYNFCQPFVQYLDPFLRFNKTMPRLTVLALLLSAEMPDFIGL